MITLALMVLDILKVFKYIKSYLIIFFLISYKFKCYLKCSRYLWLNNQSFERDIVNINLGLLKLRRGISSKHKIKDRYSYSNKCLPFLFYKKFPNKTIQCTPQSLSQFYLTHSIINFKFTYYKNSIHTFYCH